jgi:hypothetical protein
MRQKADCSSDQPTQKGQNMQGQARTPTVGRTVWFHPPKDDNDKIETHPALVTRVNADGSLELTVFLVGSLRFQRNVAPYKPDADLGGWAWPQLT